MMAWIFNEQVVSAVFLALVAITPATAAAGWFFHRRLVGRLSPAASVFWCVLGLSGPANFGLWNLYNAIENYWGLDRVEPLLINFVLFILLGVAVGLVLRVLLRRPAPGADESSADNARKSQAD